jgi:hypothetical protein
MRLAFKPGTLTLQRRSPNVSNEETWPARRFAGEITRGRSRAAGPLRDRTGCTTSIQSNRTRRVQSGSPTVPPIWRAFTRALRSPHPVACYAGQPHSRFLHLCASSVHSPLLNEMRMLVVPSAVTSPASIYCAPNLKRIPRRIVSSGRVVGLTERLPTTFIRCINEPPAYRVSQKI